ncbi:MAG: DUF4340 domain-containing protein [Candidatus Omnitrophica bacterium]|nr:DUF4340 domain-containing protein [Candidatus Omnitrophota bacterium]
MKWQTALLFIGLFLLVGAFCLLVETPFLDTPLLKPVQAAKAPVKAVPVKPKVEEVVPEKFFTKNLMELLPDDKVQWIQIQNLEQRKTFTFTLRDNQWFLKFPVQDRASHNNVQSLIQAFISVEKLRQMTPEKDWDEYGLARPRIKIGIETLKNPRRYLYLGAVSPVGNVIFARWEDEKSYFLLPENFEQLFTQSVYDFREKKIFSISESAVRRVEFKTASENFEIENQGSQWVWKQPEGMQWAPCPAGDAEALLEHLRGLFVKDFLENISDEESGLSQGGKITLWSDETHSESLQLGQEAVVRDAYYARKNGQGDVLLVAREKLNLFMELFRALADEKAIQAGPLPAPASEA